MTTAVNDTFRLEDKVAFLELPSSYPHDTPAVKTMETHMSWLFLAGDEVYKLKKPVNYELLNLTTIRSRFQNCWDEVRLNIRLAPDIYLGVCPLTINVKRELELNGHGGVVDWLVKMRRLPEELMLDYTIKNNCVNKADVKRAAKALAVFYNNATPVKFDSSVYKRKVEQEIINHYPDLTADNLNLPKEHITEIKDTLLNFLADFADLFDKRVAAGKIVEGHGDLRPEHIFLGEKPVMIDCLEFNKNLRILDTAEDIALLDLECELLGDKSVGTIFFKEYTKKTWDKVPTELVHFYKAKKALLRTFLVARHLLEEKYKNDPKWASKARRYLKLSYKYARLLPIFSEAII